MGRLSTTECTYLPRPQWGDMETDDDMGFSPVADPSGSGGPPDGGPRGPPGGGQPGGPPGGGPPLGSPYRGPPDSGPPGGPSGGDPPDQTPGADNPENIWGWIVYLERKIWNLEREAQINKIEIGKSAAVAAKAQIELDIAKFKAGKLSGVVTKLQSRLDRLEDPRSDGSDRPPPLELGSNDSWGPGPDPGRSHGRSEAPPIDRAPSTCGSARQSYPMPPRRSGDEERDKWLSADYHRRRDPLQSPFEPKRPGHAPEPTPPAYGRYGALRVEVPEEDMEQDLEGPDGDPMEDFVGSSPG